MFKPRDWSDEQKGLSKTVLKYTPSNLSLLKPTEVSKCWVNITLLEGSTGESWFLSRKEQFSIELGSATDPVDCYIELLLLQMYEGERSLCSILTKKSGKISFEIDLQKVENIQYLYKISPREAYRLSLRYKDNGVDLFKEHHLHALDYFCRAARLLITFKPFEKYEDDNDDKFWEDVKCLLENLQTNIAACKLKQGRQNDVLYLTRFVDENKQPHFKAAYRRAIAFLDLRMFEDAKKLLDRPEYKSTKEFVPLLKRYAKESKESNENYRLMVKKMFQ